MADNTTQGGGATIAADDIGAGLLVQRVKIGQGVDGSYADVAVSAPLHVNLAASAGNGAQVAASLTAAGASTLTGSGNTTGSVVIDVSTAGNASFHLLAAAFVGTVVFEQTFDPAGANGTWQLVPVIPEDTLNPPMNTLAISTAVAYVRQFSVGMLGPRLFRVRCSAFTSGSLGVLGSAGPGWYEGQPALAPGANMIGSVSLAAATTYAVTTVNTNGTANTNSVSLAADATRKGLIIWNRGTVPLYVGFGTVTSGGPPPTVYSVVIPAAQGYEVPPQFAPSAINTQTTVVSSPVQFTTAI